MKIDGCNALITGASAGIGREFARQLAGRSRSLILVARREQKLNELRDELTQHHPNLRIHIRETDLAKFPQIEELTAWLEREKIDVDLLINNAGLGDSGPFATSDPTRNEQMTLVNVVALTSLTRRLLPQMIARKRGGILIVSSTDGFVPLPELAV
jgi:short-subunit dehydrogenase